ncbi:cytidine deaminase [Chelatococcus caeni]|uniref:Cytidine deaminase n=1 Tax=Chelatococcus caeni TaxID=1348468 RepID=A0A840BR82_9HYPH|nr:anti-phage dCTP deaminase [Chelatococcus caeni]MBB4015875.1 cytidine deaminase [Chelatococcus caeni]
MPTATIQTVRRPELIFGIAGPIGVDIDEITTSLVNALKGVQYDSEVIKLTELMRYFPTEVLEPTSDDFFSVTNFKMDYANSLCRKYDNAAAMSAMAINEITAIRKKHTIDDESVPEGKAYIIRQLKRPDEVIFLRNVYGRQFILISAYGSINDRTQRIEAKLRGSLIPPQEISERAKLLIERDASEAEPYGQQLREAFHLADVFIPGVERREMDSTILRFINAFFGRNDISPSKDEYGMYAAKSASLRSSDLSRQVGAAIFTTDGELITQGCNEVPKFSGGTYWDMEEPDFRDVRIGYDPNELVKKEILRDLVNRFLDNGLLSRKAKSIGTPAHIVEELIQKPITSEEAKRGRGALFGASILDLTEYGRVVHAEMCAICDAARLGRSIKGSTLYCTTFPCHNCTKHIIASGINRVVYMEPYPKSRAKELHANEIEIEQESHERVSFVPFMGISPFRYRDIFQKGKRKNRNGTARRWYSDDNIERPMLDIVVPSYYPDIEAAAVSILFGQIKRDDTSTNTDESLNATTNPPPESATSL